MEFILLILFISIIFWLITDRVKYKKVMRNYKHDFDALKIKLEAYTKYKIAVQKRVNILEKQKKGEFETIRQAQMPINNISDLIDIDVMSVGEVGYVYNLCAIFVDIDGNVWLSKERSLDQEWKNNTIKVERIQEGFVIDVSKVKDKSWSQMEEVVDSWYWEANYVPVIRIDGLN